MKWGDQSPEPSLVRGLQSYPLNTPNITLNTSVFGSSYCFGKNIGPGHTGVRLVFPNLDKETA